MNDTILKTALSQYGTKGIFGPQAEQEVLKFYQEIGNKWVQDDDLAWCAAFAQWVCMKSKAPYSAKLNARSFLDWGRQTQKPEMGDIVVLWRIDKDGPFGHVGFYIKETSGTVYLLGGNQANSVSIAPFQKSQVLQYRTLRV